MAYRMHMNNVCRACLTTEESFTYFIFENVSSDTYCFCTSVLVSKDEELPRGVCNSCYELLKKFSEFKRTCLQSQATLLDLEKSFKNETDIRTYCEPNESKEGQIKTEVLENAVKDEDEKTDHDYVEEVYHRDGPKILEEKHFKRLVHLESKEGKIKTEVLENAVKVGDEETDHDYVEEIYHDDGPKILEEKHFKRKVKKLVKLKQCKGAKPTVKKKFIYTCDICQKKFNFKERFEAHKLEHEGKIASIHCSPCNKTFVTWSGLKRHKESEHTQVNLESLKCPTCGKIFKSRQTLKMHEKVHGNRRLIMCDVCGRGLTSFVVLRAHLETHNENRKRSFTCEQCGKKFFTKTILQSHVTRRHSGRRFICQICSFTFTDKYNLAKHLLIHEGHKLYKCEICNKSYATHSTLTEHKRLHSGERPYVCNYCLKAFVSRKRLTDHVRIHTGEKPHKCSLCEQRFTQRGTLKRHMKVHDRAAPTLAALN